MASSKRAGSERGEFIRYWDEQAKVPYLFDGETFISYEDCESLGVKIAYLKEKGMGGHYVLGV